MTGLGARYREVELRTTSPEGLIVKLYEGAIRFARRAREHGEAGRIGERGEAISRSMALVNELRQGLDFEAGGEIARNLEALYIFASDRLLEANLSGQLSELDDAVRVLEPLLEAWREIASPSGSATSAGQAEIPGP